jgi:hypothetical protein
VVRRLPALLTVEEAAKELRIGRTKAYAMAQEWRRTGGASGLPVVDFGHVLRVPRHQLELLVGGPLDDTDDRPARPVAPTPSDPIATEPLPSAPHRRTTNKNDQPKSQPQLFNPNPAPTTARDPHS